MSLKKNWIVSCARCGCLYHRMASNDICPACKSNIQNRFEDL